MNFLKENWFKLSIVLIILGTGYSIAYYFLTYIPQRDSARSTNTWLKEKREQDAKEEQNKRDYVAKRKKDCFDIYDKEKNNWNNVLGQEYDTDADICYVIYKAQQGEWSGKNCKQYLPTTSTADSAPAILRLMFNNYTDCSDNQFRKEF